MKRAKKERLIQEKIDSLIQKAELWKHTHELFMLKIEGTNELLKILEKQVVGDLKSAGELVEKQQRDLIAQYDDYVTNVPKGRKKGGRRSANFFKHTPEHLLSRLD